MSLAPITPISVTFPGIAPIAPSTSPAASPAAGTGFADLLTRGLDGIDTKLANADSLMKAYALGEAIPVHQVTIALEEARIAVELAVQVRERLTETYRSFMNMQL